MKVKIKICNKCKRLAQFCTCEENEIVDFEVEAVVKKVVDSRKAEEIRINDAAVERHRLAKQKQEELIRRLLHPEELDDAKKKEDDEKTKKEKEAVKKSEDFLKYKNSLKLNENFKALPKNKQKRFLLDIQSAFAKGEDYKAIEIPAVKEE